MANRPFVMELLSAAEGKKVKHFRTVKHDGREVKIYFTDEKIILANFQGRQFENIESRIRGSRESLLGFEALVDESIRIKASNVHLPPRLLHA